MPGPLKISEMPPINAATLVDADRMEWEDISEPDATSNTSMTLGELKKALALYQGDVYTAGLTGLATNVYAEINGIPTSTNGIIMPWNASLIAISAKSTFPDVWTAEVHVSLTLVVGALLSISGTAAGKIVFPTPINFNADDELQFFVNGTSIDQPQMNFHFARRD